MVTGNKDKITFRLNTSVILVDSFLIHQYGLTLVKSHEINMPRLDSTCLVGYVIVEGLKDITRLLFNPSIVEYVQFKNSGRLCVCTVNQNPMRVVIADQLEFNRIYHSKTIFKLVKSSETGLSVVCARIVGCFQVDQWWYPLCDCSNCIK